jgi:hypothetical protein
MSPRLTALLSLAIAAGCAPPEEQPPPAPEHGYQFLAGPWTVEPGTEIERCITIKVPETFAVGGFEVWGNHAFHHFALYATLAAMPEGEKDCRAVLTDRVMPFTQTVFSTSRQHHVVNFPEGVGGKFDGSLMTLIIAIHHLNPTKEPVEVRGAFNVVTRPEETVHTWVNALVHHVRNFTLPPRSQTLVKGHCVADAPLDVYAMGSHAHGALEKLELRITRAGAMPAEPDYVNLDGLTPRIDVFSDAPKRLEKGDGLEVRCQYKNDGDLPIIEGPKTTDEMCTGVLVYGPDRGYLRCDTQPDAEEFAH